jgi:arylsulfatase A-like enzyme
MPPTVTRWLPRSAVALLVVAAAVLAWREGGGADARVPPPRAEAAPAGKDDLAAGHGAVAYQVTTRLIDALATARIDAPSLPAATQLLQPHWRKMNAPWTHLSGVAAQIALTLSLRTSRDFETQWTVPVTGGDAWIPQARVWNMNEGSFDQREAIFAPTPATLAFRMDLPPSARLRVSPAVVSPAAATTVFDVTLVDASGAEHPVSQTRLASAEARRWVDLDLDLAAWGGQKVELRLQTSSDKPAAGEKRAAPPPAEDPDGGAPSDVPMLTPMGLAVWGDPVVVAREPTRVPYNVLWIVVDALRPDVAASLHDPAEDAARLAAPLPPLEAQLPAVPGLMPSIDRLAGRGVRFLHAWSVAAWTRPGTLAMLTGERSTELGIDTREWILQPEPVAHYYATDPPLVPLVLRKNGVATAAFVNNFFLAGYVTVGLDMGLSRVTDHRYRARDTAEIRKDALAWLDGPGKDTRFFLFVNFNSPHEPYDPPKEFTSRIPPPPAGPREEQLRNYMGEGAKDDQAIGDLLDKLDELGLTGSTIVVVTADHGETLSSAHGGFGMQHMPIRFHHAVGNYEETTRVPIVMALPGQLDGGRAVTERVRSTDIAPTILELEGLEADPRMSGRSMMPLVRGQKEEPRAVVTEGRASRALLWGRWHLITHDIADFEEQLFDLDVDPGERRNVAHAHPDVVAEMRARLAAAVANQRAADVAPSASAGAAQLPVLHLRFAGAGGVRRISGAMTVGDGKHGASVTIEPVGVAREAIRVDGPRVDFALQTAPDALVGLDVRVDPAGAPVAWKLALDDAPWPEHATFTGPFGLPAVAARDGIGSDEARAEAFSTTLPVVDPSRDLGVFVTRDRPGDATAAIPTSGGAGAVEMQRMLQQWGYAHGSH